MAPQARSLTKIKKSTGNGYDILGAKLTYRARNTLLLSKSNTADILVKAAQQQ